MAQRPIIYQVLPRLYGNIQGKNKSNGSIEENGCGKMNFFTMKELRRIRDFGFTHIWYTGLIEHATKTSYAGFGIATDCPPVVKGNAGSPYAIKDYYDIDPDLSEDVAKRKEEFSALLERTHKAGLKFVMDFVPNHVARQYHSDSAPKGVADLGEKDDTNMAFSPQNNFYYNPGQELSTDAFDGGDKSYHEFPAKATGNDHFDAWPGVNDWYETVKLNYGVDYLGGRTCHFEPRPNTWDKMTDILLYWAGLGVDAFRCDMAEMVPAEFWDYALTKVKAAHPTVQFIAEVYNPGLYRRYLSAGFDYLYDKVGLYDALRAVVCHQASASCITGCWQVLDDIQDHMLNFLENHDEQRIASDFFAGRAEKALPALVVSALMNTRPFLLYAGQEIGERGMDSEGFSGRDGRTTIFDYWAADCFKKLAGGNKAFSADEKYLYSYYKKVLHLCNNDEAISEGDFFDLMYVNYDRQHNFNPDRHYAFLRHSKKNGETVLVVVNFDENPAELGVRIPRHAFSYLGMLPGERKAKDLLSGKSCKINFEPDRVSTLNVPGWGAAVLKL